MSNIVIKITIPEKSYKNWSDYENNGIEEVKRNLEREFIELCNQRGFDVDLVEVKLD